ncbi:DUF934 domain-containing protein [Pokkaliibacter sp. CJK22405]|uniref:DUF934 domain-containing protein n=1 Tax=Pokkaliibacter sp. CJK22405 TaxID=3384615 RepID=UPI003984FA75
MPLIRNTAEGAVVVSDEWTLLLEQDAELPSSKVLVPLARYLDATGGDVAPVIAPDDDVLAHADALKNAPLVAINFPAFTDGRGFTHARMLRERLGYTGEIRAVGDVSRDRLEYMARCGFDTFLIPEERFKPEVLAAFDDISVDYQGGAYDPRPLFRRQSA